MKLNKLIYGVVFAVLLITAGSSCRKGQFNINKNINQPTDSTITYNAVTPAAMNATGSIIARRWGTIQNWMSYWARSGTYAPNVTEETYQITTLFGNAVWDACYDNAYDYEIVRIKAAQAGAGFYEGIARIMKTIDFQILVDVYGDVPYSQALKGSGNPTPAYDKGVDIYKALLREIDAGILLIRRAVVTTTNANKDIATEDIMFHGDRNMWVKFANTLKLRLLIHAYAVGAIDKNVELTIINNTVDTAAGNTPYGYLGAGQTASVNPGYASVDKPNPFYNQYVANTDGSTAANNVYYKANEWGIEYYKWDGDPRVTNVITGGDRIYTPGSGGRIGVAYGLPPITANAATVLAGIGPGVYKSVTAPQAILTSSESLFLQAEAKQRGWNIITPGTAQQLMNAAMDESFIYYGVPNAVAAAAAYRTANQTYPDVDYNGVAQGTGAPVGGLFTILSQKWFAMNGVNTLETWTDWRRVPYTEVATKVLYNNSNAPTTNFVYGDGGFFFGGTNSPGPGPFRSVSPQITAADNIPVRYLYPQSEYNYNPANVGAQGTITRYSRVFWDLQ
ncbi:MAG: SusD/RagB family nutrient-binding outer membrane lipoprotein [Sphingobacteriales bacterium]|nr:SusD/RagB family nutrient-binding outer membrane lipoprotein [Sphingobacteriales bacterium]